MPNQYGQRRNFGEVLSDALNFAGQNYLPYKQRQRAEKRQTGLDRQRTADRDRVFSRQQMADAAQSIRDARAERQRAFVRGQTVNRADVAQTNRMSDIEAQSIRDTQTKRDRDRSFDEMVRQFDERESRLSQPRPTTGTSGSASISPSGFPVSALSKLGDISAENFLERRETIDPDTPEDERSFAARDYTPPFGPRTDDSLAQAYFKPFFQYGGYGQQVPDTGFGNALRQNGATGGGQFDQSIISNDDEAYGLANIRGWIGLTPDQKLDELTKARLYKGYTPTQTQGTGEASELTNEELLRQLGLGGGA